MWVKVAKAQCSISGRVFAPEQLSGGTVLSYPFLADSRCFGDPIEPQTGWYNLRRSDHACLCPKDDWCLGTMVYATLEVEE